MNAGTVVAIFMGVFVAMTLPLLGWKDAENRARERRMAEHQMNARLLRFNI